MTKEEILNLIPKKKWTSATTPGHLVFCYGWMVGYSRLRKYFSRYPDRVFFLIDKTGLGFEYIEKRQVFADIKQLYDDSPSVPAKITAWEKQRDDFYKNWWDVSSLANKDDASLAEDFEKLASDVAELWAAPIVVDLLGVYTETELYDRFFKALPAAERGLANEYFAVISQPTFTSFVTKEYISLLKLAMLLKQNDPRFHEFLRTHQQSFFWIGNTYRRIQTFDEKHFKRKINNEISKSQEEILKEVRSLESAPSDLERKKKELLKKINLPRDLVNKLALTPLLSVWLDKRKEYNLRSNHILNEYIKEIAKRLNKPIEILYHLLPSEVAGLLRGKKLSSRVIDLRRQSVVYVTTPSEDEYIFSGRNAEIIINTFHKCFLRDFKSIKGMVASRGNARSYEGIVRIIHDPNKDIFNEGDILVTSITRPEFVPIMRKALCVITDEGGIASHAAIVSRELGVPCVIGTKFATKVLKNGDKVEIDVVTGVVRLI